MTAPGANPGPVVYPTVPTNPDGTPNYGAAAGGGGGSTPVDRSGTLSLWNIPKEIAGQMIWYDTGIRKQHANAYSPGAEHDSQVDEHLTKLVDISHPQILRSPTQIMKQFAAMSFNDPNGFFAIQKALASGPWGTVHATGAWDSDTESALGNAMLQYVKLSAGAGVGVSFTDYLLKTGERAQQLGGDGTSLGTGSGSSTRAPFQASVSDPAQIRAAAEQAFQAAVGRGASEKQLDAFVAQFQAAQTSAERTNYNGTGTVTAPDLTSQAGQYAQQQDPQGYKQHQATSYTNALVNLLFGSNIRPDIQPVASA